MGIKSAFALVLVLVFGWAFWMTGKVGEYRAENVQLEQTVQDQNILINKQAERTKFDHALLLKSRQNNERINREANDLRKQLNELEGCSAAVIEPSTRNGVFESRKNRIH